jgi:hypothetical protein
MSSERINSKVFHSSNNDSPSDKVVKDVNWKLKVVTATRDSGTDIEARVEIDFESMRGFTTSMEFGEQGMRKLYESLEEVQSKLDQHQSKVSEK